MSNFIEEFKKGQSDSTKGLPFGSGLESITLDVGGVHSKAIYGVAGPEKSGKSTFTDYAFLIQPYLYAIEHNVPVSWVYYSFEVDRVSKEFDFASFFLNHDYGINEVPLPTGITRDGKDTITISAEYLKGLKLDDNFNSIKIDPEIEERLKEVYKNRIVPLFGEYSKSGALLKKGMIDFREGRDNPTGIYKDLLKLAEEEGTIFKSDRDYPINYVPGIKNQFKIVIIDHIRKLRPERGWKIKQTIDKMSEYMVILRNLLGYTFVPILHTNRSLGTINRLTYAKNNVYPNSDDLKDSGNLGEDCNYLFTTFNPNDDRYNLRDHFDLKIRDSRSNIIYPNLRTIHLVSSRHCEFPRHYKVNMFGGIKKFEKL